MPMNEGGLDRMLRVVAGLGIISLAFVGSQRPGLEGFCPAYALFAI